MTTTISQDSNIVVISRREHCPHCDKLKDLLYTRGFKYREIFAEDIRSLFKLKHKTVPQVYVDGEYLGNGEETSALVSTSGKIGKIKEQWVMDGETYDLEDIRDLVRQHLKMSIYSGLWENTYKFLNEEELSADLVSSDVLPSRYDSALWAGYRGNGNSGFWHNFVNIVMQEKERLNI